MIKGNVGYDKSKCDSNRQVNSSGASFVLTDEDTTLNEHPSSPG